MSIPFTQFLRPDGRRKDVTIDMPADVEAQAHELIEAGYRFEIEELTTGEIFMTCTTGKDDDPYFNDLCDNGPGVRASVADLVARATALAFPEGEQLTP